MEVYMWTERHEACPVLAMPIYLFPARRFHLWFWYIVSILQTTTTHVTWPSWESTRSVSGA
jgi:hypothetical protein